MRGDSRRPFRGTPTGRRTHGVVWYGELSNSEPDKRWPESIEKSRVSRSFDGEASPRVRRVWSLPLESLLRPLMSEHDEDSCTVRPFP